MEVWIISLGKTTREIRNVDRKIQETVDKREAEKIVTKQEIVKIWRAENRHLSRDCEHSVKTEDCVHENTPR